MLCSCCVRAALASGRLMFSGKDMHKKRGAGLSPVPHSKGSRIARLIETSNAESPTPMDYIDTSTGHGFRGHSPVACIQYTSRGVPVALFLTNRFEFARFLECQNQSVQLRLLCMSACCTALPERLFQAMHAGATKL